jgi:signal transduction histidine kinase
MWKKGTAEPGIQASFKKGISHIFQIASYIIIIGSVVDMICINHHHRILTLGNLSSALLAVLFLALYYFRVITCRHAFAVLIYNILINLLIIKYVGIYTLGHGAEVNLFMRDSVFVFLFLTLAAFAIHRIHALLIGFGFLVVSAHQVYLLHDPFLTQNAILLAITLTAYCGLIWYLVGVFDTAIADQRRKSRLVRAQSVQLLKRNEELSSLNHSKDLLMAVIGHDLKNPFNVILLSAQILESKYQNLNDDQKKKIIESIRVTSMKTYDLLQNLLKWSRLQSGSPKCRPETIDLVDVFHENIELMAANILRKEIIVVRDCPESLKVTADRDMISTVVRNLLSNAVKYTGPNGYIKLHCDQDSQTVTCHIEDSGTGMSKEQVQHLFDIEKFMLTRDTEGSAGSGLGLILCKEFLVLNNGTLSVKSEKGSGSVFSFTLPKPVN